MTPLPAALGGNELIAWRLDQAPFAAHWDSGGAAYRFGGRWNSKGVRAVYCSIDPSTAILEVAVHKGFITLDVASYVLTSVHVADSAAVRVIGPETVPDPDWLTPGIPSAEQQAFGDELLATYRIVVIPSVVSSHSWNLIFAEAANNTYTMRSQKPFVLDPRLHPSRRA
jgi:RES domain-containing protein